MLETTKMYFDKWRIQVQILGRSGDVQYVRDILQYPMEYSVVQLGMGEILLTKLNAENLHDKHCKNVLYQNKNIQLRNNKNGICIPKNLFHV